ncbi:LpqB family beta-propeller domain-containing protein [Corynebacterium uterequi]|uniref:Lipoprotein LpqB n=1 Tax=Corynebacterium uterequi TaxID=1072256 RepID=A0A0G3HH70_9CORY|nr:LpqB family beta-propeller domain-containing protein [Corynebacterium uterequi]AKK10527.1 sporulation/spore germination protein [Corynebacterium uterequi]
MPARRRVLLPAVLTLSAVGLTACVTVPTNQSAPVPLRTFDAATPTAPTAGPAAGADPADIVKGFYAAAANPAGNHAEARTYLASSVAESWRASTPTTIVERMTYTTEVGSDSEISITATGTAVGELAVNGAYHPMYEAYEATLELVREHGEWRVAALPDEVAIEQTELRNRYQPHELYFYDQSGRRLVADRRWVYTENRDVDEKLMSMLVGGPAAGISAAVVPAAPDPAVFVGRRSGEYLFEGFGALDEASVRAFAAQVVWTLSAANVQAPYHITIDGVPITTNGAGLTTDDFVDYNPRLANTRNARLFVLAGGQILGLDENSTEALPGQIGGMTTLASADVSSTGDLVAVDGQPGAQRLLMGTEAGPAEEIEAAETFTAPSFVFSGGPAWTVADGRRIMRLTRSSATGKIVVNEADGRGIPLINDPGSTAQIEEFRISPSGARVAMLIDNRLFIGVIGQLESGNLAVVDVYEAAHELGGHIDTLDWLPSNQVLLGTSLPAQPVWQVEMDGSAKFALSTNNIAAPVTEVAASSTSIFATGGDRLRSIPRNEATGNGLWVEVDQTRGLRAEPIVAN